MSGSHKVADITGPLAIMGGAFDPVHIGHLRAAVELSELLELSELRFVPSANPPHRDPHIASGEQRVAMLEAAIADLPWCKVDQRELHREGPSWSVATMQELRAEYPGRSISMILGMDAFLGLPNWHRWTELLDLAHIVVAYRPGHQPPEQGTLGELLYRVGTDRVADLHKAHCGRILVREVTQLEISSSQIRDFLTRGMDIRYLVPDAVASLLADTDLYNSPSHPSGKEQGKYAK